MEWSEGGPGSAHPSVLTGLIIIIIQRGRSGALRDIQSDGANESESSAQEVSSRRCNENFSRHFHRGGSCGCDGLGD